MSGAKHPSETIDFNPELSSDAQQDLESALDETVDAQKAWVKRNRTTIDLKPGLSFDGQKDLESALGENEDVQMAWVERNRSGLLGRPPKKRRAHPPARQNVDVFAAVEGTEKDLRQVLNRVYKRHGPLAMGNDGLDEWDRRLVLGYQVMAGRKALLRVVLYVEEAGRSGTCPISNDLPAIDEGEEAELRDADRPVMKRFKRSRP